MKTFKKRLSAVLLSVYMVFGVVSTDYLTVQAFEWVVPSLTVGESLLWLIGLLGITYTEGASAWRDVSPEYEQEFIDYANEHGLTYTQTNTWLNDVASGKLNQLSEVWTNFKDWLKSKLSSTAAFDGTCSSVIQREFPSVTTIDNIANNFEFTSALKYTSGSATYYFFCPSNSTVSVYDNGGTLMLRITGNYVISTSVGLTSTSTYVRLDRQNNGSVFYFYNTNDYYFYNFDIPAYSNCFNWDLTNEGDSDLSAYNPALVPDISFADSNTEDASIPGVIDLPWGNLGDDEEERDKTYDDLVGGLDLGQELGDLWQALQDLMGVLAVDDAGVLQPNSGGENPPTLEDEADKNKANGAFVLTGLQKVFPFCIPFDLYAFITLLEAPPVAPVIQYPIYNPVTKSNEIITIDFSTWESVVILFRYIFDFLFIIGLLLMARALIGGGDSA